MDLHLFDASNYIYAGNYSGEAITRGIRENDGLYEANSFPIGGVNFLLRELNRYRSCNTILMPIFDRPAMNKRKMYLDLYGDPYGYKGTRKEAGLDITLQKEYAEQICRMCGFPVQAAEGYESDDIIYTMVEVFKYDFNKIYVHTKDSDLHFLVSDNVEIAKVGAKGKSIDMSNYYFQACSCQGIVYNTSLLHKLIQGDKADNIPGVGEHWRSLFEQVLPTDAYPNLGDLDVCRQYLREASIKFPTAQNAPILTSVFNLLAPLRVPYNLLCDSEYDVNWDMFDYYKDKHDASQDRWGCEEVLRCMIDKYYE